MKSSFFSILTIALAAATAPLAHAQLIINTSSGLFAPSFRDSSNTDLNNTTWWGWSSGSFDQPVDNELVNNPPPTLGVGGLDGTLNQQSTNDILSSSNNIYTASFGGEVLDFGIPTNGSVGSGFTTIIIQGRTAFGGFNGGNPGLFSAIGGVNPTLVSGVNALGRGQFWAKYEISGNAASYLASFEMPELTSIAELTVDTQWSNTGFSTDTALVPEPSTWALIAIGGLFVLYLRRNARGRAANS